MIRRIIKWLLIPICAAALALAAYYVISLIPMDRVDRSEKISIPVDGSKYYDDFGQPGQNLWLSDNGDRYYVGSDSVIVKDQIIEDDGKSYYLGADGILVVSRALLLKGTLYRADTDGVLTIASGLIEVDGQKYYANQEGTPVKNWMVTEGGRQYFFNADGLLMKDQMLLYQGKSYQADADGELKSVAGWQQVGDKKYYSRGDGTLVRNAQIEDQGKTLYLDDEGQIVTDGFYTYDDALYYADASGATRREEGWFSLNGKEYYSDSTGAFYCSQYINVDNKKYFMDKTGAKLDGKPTIDQYLKCDNLYGYMTDHFSEFYFQTPYRDLYGNTTRPERLIMPIGLYGDDAGMNCTGFISSLIKGAGGDLDLVTAMGRFGGYGNADNYLMLATKGVVQYEVFPSVSALLKSGKAKKGNIFYLAPKWKSGDDCHMAVFWGDTPSENKIWSQTAKTLCTVTEIYMVDPINQIFMFPLECNLEE